MDEIPLDRNFEFTGYINEHRESVTFRLFDAFSVRVCRSGFIASSDVLLPRWVTIIDEVLNVVNLFEETSDCSLKVIRTY